MMFMFMAGFSLKQAMYPKFVYRRLKVKMCQYLLNKTVIKHEGKSLEKSFAGCYFFAVADDELF